MQWLLRLHVGLRDNDDELLPQFLDGWLRGGARTGGAGEDEQRTGCQSDKRGDVLHEEWFRGGTQQAHAPVEAHGLERGLSCGTRPQLQLCI